MNVALMTVHPGGTPSLASMDYIKLLNRFWKLHKEKSFSTAEIALYLHLLDICNGLSWKNPFQQSNILLCASLGISEKTLIAARATLQIAGLLDFTPGHKRMPTTYRLAAHATLFSLEDNQENTLEILQPKLQPIRELTPLKPESQLPNTLENVASSINKTSSIVENKTKEVGREAPAASAPAEVEKDVEKNTSQTARQQPVSPKKGGDGPRHTMTPRR